MDERNQRENEDITEEFKKEVGKLLREQRVTLNRTQEEVAAKLHTSVETVRRWENGISFPSPRYRRTLTKLFKLSKDTFAPVSKQSKQTSVEHEVLLPPPIPRTYKGWRTGNYASFVPGEWPRYDYEERNQGAGETHVTVNGYPLDFFNLNEYPPFSYRLD